MKDPYKVLGVSPSDSDETIKAAYKELVKKYHPDNYAQNPLGDLADEKMAEINAAYDEIMNMRRGSGNGGAYSNSNNSGSYGNGGSHTNFNEIRLAIQRGEVTKADDLLERVPENMRNAEWNFLKGSVCYKRGWLNEAYEYISAAARMNPANREYQAALNRLQASRNGNMNGAPNNPYRTSTNVNNCDGCDCCTNLICADCCCECMGGDLISCC